MDPLAAKSDSQSSTGLIDWLSTNRRTFILGEFILGGILAILTVVFFIDSKKTTSIEDKEKSPKLEKSEEKPESILDPKKEAKTNTVIDSGKFYLAFYFAALGLAFLIHAGVWASVEDSAGASQSFIRTGIALLGLGVGMATILLSLNIAYRSQEDIMKWLTGTGTQPTTEETDPLLGAKLVLLSLFVLLGGLAIIFFSSQPARAEERNNPTLRRLVYGSNAIMTGLLLLVVLVAINVRIGMKVPGKIDTTEAKFYTLDEKSQELLKGLEEPVNAYLICPTDLPANLYGDLQALLNNCESASQKFKAHFLLPGVDDDEITKIQDRLKLAATERSRVGMIVAVGENQDRVTFLRLEPDLFSGDGENLTFEGEGKLMTELTYLTQSGGKPPIIYFTQGNDEPQVEPGPGAEGNRRSATLLARYLKDRKFDVKPLRFELGKKPTLDENTAAIVVFGPHKTFTPEAAKFLQDYVRPPTPNQKPGKLVLLLPPFKQFDSDKIAETGFEGMLSEFGIDLKPERLVTAPVIPNIPPEMVQVRPSREIANTPLVRVVNRGYVFYGTRLLEPGGPPNPRFTLQSMLITDRQLPTWLETSYSDDPDYYDKILERLRKDEKLAQTKKVANRSDPVALMISESSGPPPNPMGPPPSSTPRMVIFGTEAFVTDEFLNSRGRNRDPYLELFTATLDWLRERPTSIGIQPRAHKAFIVDRDTLDGSRLFIYPPVYMLASIIGIGLVVWVIRRK